MKLYNEQHIGETHVSNEGYNIVVVKGSEKNGHIIVSIDGKYDKIVQYSQLVRGKVKNLYHKSVFGKGYVGIGKHKAYIKGAPTKKYITWSGMLQRCYDPDYHIKRPTYKDVTVCDEWHNYQTFGDWYDKQYKEDDWQLDKDLLSDSKKVYSPDTCLFIPRGLKYFLIRRETKNRDYPAGVKRSISKYLSRISCSSSGRHLYLGTFDTIEEADLAYRNKRLDNMLFWLESIDNHQHIDRRVYEEMKVIYEEYKKERDDLEERITNNLRGVTSGNTKAVLVEAEKKHIYAR